MSGRCSGHREKDKFLLFLIPGEVCSQVVPASLESLESEGKRGRIWTNLISRETSGNQKRRPGSLGPEEGRRRRWTDGGAETGTQEVRSALHLRSLSLRTTLDSVSLPVATAQEQR